MEFKDNEDLSALVRCAPIGICILNANNFVAELLNDKFLEIAGKQRDEVLGKFYWESFSEVRMFYEKALQNVAKTGEAFHANEAELLLIRNGKEERLFVTFVYAPIKDTQGITTKIAIWVLENTTQVVARQKVDAAKEAIETERNKLYKFFDQVPAGICIFNGPELVYELANPAYRRLVPHHQLIGRSLFNVMPELVGAPIQQLLLDVYHTGKTCSIEEMLVSVRKYEGGPVEDRYFTFTYSARYNEKNQIDGLLGFVIEVTHQVTARRELEAAEKHFRLLANVVPAKISNALPNGEVIFLNQKWLDYSKLKFDQMRDFGYHQMMHPDEIPEFQAGLAEAAALGKPFEMEMRFKDAEGNYRWHLNIASPVIDDDGRIAMWVGSTTDIQRIKDEEQRKNDFISMVSHELKTPLTSLSASLQLLVRRMSKAEDPLVPRLLNQSVKQMAKMTSLINGFLDVTRLESGQIRISKKHFSMQELFAEIKEEVEYADIKHRVKFVSCDVSIYADVEKIGQVLHNLINNAAKYSRSDSLIDVSCKVQDTKVLVSVADKGMGIKKSELQHIFKRFYRVDAEQKISGFGIGLYFCAEIIKLHGGQLWAESIVGTGSTFYFTLPL